MEHNRLLRESLADLGGQEVKTEDDSFFFTFPSAIDAVTGAVRIQKQMIDRDLGVQIRVGIHTGEPAFRDNDYFGPLVNRANRVCDAALGQYAHSRGFITPQATEMIQCAIDCVRESGDTESLAAPMLGMGAIAWMHRRFDEAAVMLSASLKFFRAGGASSSACRALNLLGLIASDDGNQEEANAYLQDGLDIARSAGLVREEALLLQNQSLVLLRGLSLVGSAGYTGTNGRPARDRALVARLRDIAPGRWRRRTRRLINSGRSRVGEPGIDLIVERGRGGVYALA